MNRTGGTEGRRGNPVPRRGFALVVSLALAAFLLALMVVSSTVLRLAAAETANGARELRAREHALLGLAVAVSHLAETAGGDQVATYPADLLAESGSPPPESRRRWTGVVPAGEDPPEIALTRWLVSTAPEGADPAAAGGDRLETFEADGGTVEAPFEPTAATGNAGFAYWIDGEARKAKATLAGMPEEPARLTTRIALRSGIEVIEGLDWIGERIAGTDEEREGTARLARLQWPEDLASAGPLPGRGKLAAVTTTSLGVLSNPRRGGLQTDLTEFLAADEVHGGTDFVVPEDAEEWSGQPLSDEDFFVDRRGPSWALVQDFANLPSELDAGSVGPRISPEAEPPERGREAPPFGTEVSVTPVPVHVGLGFGLAAEEERRETLTLTEGEGPDRIEEEVERVYYRLHLVVEPVVALWNPYDAVLEERDYLVEFTFGNGLWGAQPALTLRNESLIPYHIDGIDGRLTGRQRDFVPRGGTDLEGFLEEWRIHLPEVLPDFPRSDLQTFTSYGRHEQNRDYASARDGGAWPENFHVAMESVRFEPGEIKVFMAPETESQWEGEGKVLEEGLSYGDYRFPIDSTAGWKSLSASSPVDGLDDPSAFGNYRFLPGYEVAVDPGLVVLDQASEGQGLALPSATRVGLGHRGGQYGVLLRMRDPEDGGDIAGALDEPLGDDADTRATTPWRPITYLNLQPGRNVSPNAIDFAGGSGWKRYALGTGIVSMAPHRERFHIAAPDGLGIRQAVTNPRSRSNGWDFVRSPRYGRLGYMGTGPANYGFLVETAPEEAFDPSQLWDPSAFTGIGSDPEPRVVLYHLPREELFGIADLRHLETGTTSWDPSYVIGGGTASPWIPSEEVSREIERRTIHDRSWFLNRALWDDSFFSTWDPDTEPSPDNPRLIPIPSSDGTDDRPAANLLVDGAFNVNSVSEDAWAAVLSGANLLPVRYFDPRNGGGSVEMEQADHPFFRFPVPLGGPAKQPGTAGFESGDSSYWRGFRELTDVQVRELAAEIVELVRENGPFGLLSDFVNRRPGPPEDPRSARGLLQLAIHRQSREGSEPINPAVPGADVTAELLDQASGANIAFEEPLLGSRYAGAPGYLMQGDLLGLIGPLLTTRSDTFTVRTRGISGDGGERPSSAECEAVFQRLPRYPDGSDDPAADPGSPGRLGERFGRSFVLLSFRWID